MSTPQLVIRSGSRGVFVERLQSALNGHRPLGSRALVVDGVCGPATLTAAAHALGRPSVGPLSRGDLKRIGVNVLLLADMSGHNEGGPKRLVDVDRMAADGVNGCWWKLTQGRTYLNTEARRQIDEAGSVMRRGGYHFGDPSADRTGLDLTALFDDARQEAEAYLRAREVFGGAGPELPDVLDLEHGIGSRLKGALLAAFRLDKAKRHEFTVRWALAWLEHVTRRTGRRAWWYSSKIVWFAHLRLAPPALLAELATYSLWLASYGSAIEAKRPMPRPFPRHKAHQFTGSGTVAGVDGRVDLSWALAEDLTC